MTGDRVWQALKNLAENDICITYVNCESCEADGACWGHVAFLSDRRAFLRLQTLVLAAGLCAGSGRL